MARKVVLLLLLMIAMTVPPVSAQGSATRVRELAQRLGQVQEFAPNVRLRFQVLAREADALEGKGDLQNYMRFFSDTRVMVWNRPVSPATEQTMVQLEGQMVELGAQRGFALDLPPVGYSPRGAARLVPTERLTSEGLHALVLATEEMATEMLRTHDSAELLFLRDNLSRLREDAEDKSVSTDSVRAVLGARARLLTQDKVALEPRLLERMNRLGEALRGTFPPKTLRAGGQVAL